MMQLSSSNSSQTEMKIPPFLNQISGFCQQKPESKSFTNQLPQLDSKLLQNVLDVQAAAMQMQHHAVGELLQSVVEAQPLPVMVQMQEFNQSRKDSFSNDDGSRNNLHPSTSEIQTQSTTQSVVDKQSTMDLNQMRDMELQKSSNETWNHFI